MPQVSSLKYGGLGFLIDRPFRVLTLMVLDLSMRCRCQKLCGASLMTAAAYDCKVRSVELSPIERITAKNTFGQGSPDKTMIRR
jgi:hypothetical protein